jgi:Cft2 family RNA processing exonuclease
MSALAFRFHRGGIHFPKLDLWLDATRPQKGAGRVFVSHAHADHIAAHREVILTPATSCFMQSRLGGKNRIEHRLEFGRTAHFDDAEVPFDITLLPAGHILGSAMALIECGGESLLYTGDFRLRAGLAVEACAPRRADMLIMETTFGRPHYRFPPAPEIFKAIIRFCRDAIDADETPVLLSYSLGKSQEVLQGLLGSELTVMLHEQAFKMALLYEQFGQTFPVYKEFDPTRAFGRVVIYPPGLHRSKSFRSLGKIRSAVISGWAMDSSCRFQSQADAAFPLSDHADFDELLELVRRVSPRKVFTTHGFAADFAWTLRDLGLDAGALGGPEQLSLPLFGGRHSNRSPDSRSILTG